MAVTGHAVVIAGGGPTGMMLAAELALVGVDVAIVERRAGGDLAGSRAGGLHSRTTEVLDQRGIADRFLSEGQVAQVGSFAGVALDIGDFPTRHNYGLALWQNRFEEILAGWVDELGVPIYHGRDVTGFAQDDTGVRVELSDGQSLRAEFLVGCDGGRSLIRKAAGIEFPGWDPSVSSLIAEVEMSEEPEWGIRHDDNGTQALGRLEDGKRVRLVVTERYAGQSAEPTQHDLSQALVAVWGTDYGAHSPTWISRFTDTTRQAASYRKERVLLAGRRRARALPGGWAGPQHRCAGCGEPGMEVGPGSSRDIAGKPAGYLPCRAAPGRCPRVAEHDGADCAHPLRCAYRRLRDILSELLTMEEPRKRLAGMMSGLDIHYDLGEGHPLLGRRMPDLDLVTANGPVRVFTLLHNARPVLLNLGEPGGLDIPSWADRVQLINAKHVGIWELPVVGPVPAPAAVLIRPDGHVAWVGDHAHAELPDALTAWFGPPTAG
jgi:3-(3-hydroxy-phenyl)propionate hydroxylase